MSVPKQDRCPLCKRGQMFECVYGWFCSRRYAPRRPCRFDIGDGEPVAAALARARKARSLTA